MRKQIIKIDGIEQEIDIYDDAEKDILYNNELDDTIDLEKIINQLESDNNE